MSGNLKIPTANIKQFDLAQRAKEQEAHRAVEELRKTVLASSVVFALPGGEQPLRVEGATIREGYVLGTDPLSGMETAVPFRIIAGVSCAPDASQEIKAFMGSLCEKMWVK